MPKQRYLCGCVCGLEFPRPGTGPGPAVSSASAQCHHVTQQPWADTLSVFVLATTECQALEMTNYPSLADCSTPQVPPTLFLSQSDPVQMATAVGRGPEAFRLPLTTHYFCKADFLEETAWRSPAAWGASLELLWRLFCKKRTQPAAAMVPQSCCSPALSGLDLCSLPGMPLVTTNHLSVKILSQNYLFAQAST